MIIETDRLILRRWQKGDLAPFAALTADPEVMEFFPAPLSASEAEAMIHRIEEKFEREGYCFFAAELKARSEFIGFIGLSKPGFVAHFTPCVEIGWRLARRFWGQGLAPEGAQACLNWGFGELGLKEIVAITAVGNAKSRRVMEKIGMTYDPQGDFDHPAVPAGHPLRRHVLYRIQSS